MAVEAAKDAKSVERDKLVSALRRSIDLYAATVSDVPDRAATVAPAEGKWSVLQVTEHLSNAEVGMTAMWEKNSTTGTSDRGTDEKIPLVARDRSSRREAPPASVPTGRHAKLADALTEFRANREKTIAMVQSANDLRDKSMEHRLGLLDLHQLMLLISAHTERHVEQLREIKDSAPYQKAIAQGK